MTADAHANLIVPVGRLSRGNGRRFDRLTLLIPFTASGLIAEDTLASALAILLTYAPYALDPAQFRPILANALITIAQDTTA